ncbi:RCO1 Transcriptional regulatory protein RCO1 [Candida maltosa Xu316]
MSSQVGGRAGSNKTSRDILSMLNGDARNRSITKKNKSPPANTNNNAITKRKSARIAQLEASSTPKLAASPNIKEKTQKTFIEPPLAAPKPGITGVPLENFPPHKVKKESLWPAKLRRNANGNGNGNGSGGGSSKEESPSLEILEVESSYQKNLKQTPATEESNTRDPLSHLRRSRRIKLIPSTPKEQPQGNKRSANGNSSKRPIKKIKITSPAKSPKAKLFSPSKKEDQQPPQQQQQQEEDNKENDDFCFSCGMPGVFICCESCPKSFHFTCCDPPLEEAPEDEWYCQECFAKNHPTLIRDWKGIGIFGPLLNKLETKNPKNFQLPKDLREETFMGVTTDDNGDYLDDTVKEDIPPAKINGSQIQGCNRNEDLEIDSLYDEYGYPYLCHECGDSGQNGKTLIHCDYCPLVYHIDCLNPPMFGPKTIGDKWRCPNHIEDLLPKGFPKLRQFKDAEVIENSLSTDFLNIAALSNIFIKFDDEPYLKDQNKKVTYKAYRNYEENRKVLKKWGDDMDAIHPDYEVPDFLQTISTSTGISAPKKRNLAMPSAFSNHSTIYRIPELSKQKVLEDISHYDTRRRIEENPEELQAIEGLNEIKERQKVLNLDALLKVVGQQPVKQEEVHLENDEIQELLKIKQLMETKGQKALMEFLQQ